MTKQELLQKRAGLIDEADKLLVEAEKTGALTEEQEAKVQDLQKQAANIDKLLEMRGAVDESKKDFEMPAVIPEMHKEGDKNNGGFKNFGEFMHAVRFGDKKGRLDVLKEQNMETDTAGGFLVPEQFSSDILRISAETTIARSRATVIPAGSPPDAVINIPVLNYSANVLGGVTVNWIEEGTAKPDTQAAFATIDLAPKELAGTITVTDKLLRNWAAASAFLSNLLGSAIASAEDTAFLKGDGTGKPIGVLNAANTGLKSVARATTGVISYDDVANMLVAAKLDEIESYTWIAHQSAIPSLLKLQDASGNYIFIMGDATKGIPSMLAGRPIVFTGKTSALGAAGDLALVDFSKYLIKDGSGLYVGASEHALWTENKTIIKAFTNVDGKPWVTGEITLADGVTKVSPYIILAAGA